MYLFKTPELISGLLKCISTILNTIDVSFEDTMKHRIRKCVCMEFVTFYLLLFHFEEDGVKGDELGSGKSPDPSNLL